MNLDPSQRAAVAAATSRPFSIITGGAGCGKTVLIGEITRALEARGEIVALAAFAGKAAARIREACAHPASTIHRLLMYDGNTFNLDSLADRTVIVDEASMIDAGLLAELVKRAPRRLVLVGDEAQLPPVGRGQPPCAPPSSPTSPPATAPRKPSSKPPPPSATAAAPRSRPPARENTGA
jgi:exodeoxyribonuclease V alpha subunit